jgi:hypothetical protein
MKVAIIAVVLAAVTGAAGYFGLSLDGESGDKWYGIFGLPFMLIAMVTRSPVLTCLIHLALCAGVVFLIDRAIARGRRGAK